MAQLKNLLVSGDTSLVGNVSLLSDLYIKGGVALGSTLSVAGATTLSSTLSVTGATTLSSTLSVTGATTLSSTLKVKGTTTSYAIQPAANNTYDLGTSALAWQDIYGLDYYVHNGSAQYGRLYISATGTACTTEGTAGTTGVTYLILGNGTAVSTTAGSGANNAKGILRLYGNNTGYVNLQYIDSTTSTVTATFPAYGGNVSISYGDYNPTTATAYKIPFYMNSKSRLGENDGFQYKTLQGTTSATGYGMLILGNATASGTAGNKYGVLRLYGSDTSYSDLYCNNVGSYGALRSDTLKGGYYGILFGTANSGMAIISQNAAYQGLYNQAKGKWIIQYHGTNDAVGINGSYNSSYGITLNGSVYGTSSLTIEGATVLKNTLSVASTATLTGAVTAKSTLTAEGQIFTSFKSSVATGSYGSSTTTVANLLNEVRYSSGCMGSVSISTAYTSGNVTIATGWYNFIWIPHRSGGVNGAASGDNCNYGTLFLMGMTSSLGNYRIRYASSAISEVVRILESNSYSAFADDRYVNVTGDTMTGALTLAGGVSVQRVGTSSSWYNGRDNAIIRQTSYTGYNPVLSCKTTNGSWELGPYTSNYLYFVYNTDTGYSSGTNTSGQYYNSIKLDPTGVLYGACWNDYAEYRAQKEMVEPGYCVTTNDKGEVSKTTELLQYCDGIVSDTYGFAIGETEGCKTPLAVAGRVLAYCYGDRCDYHAGDTVCAGPNGLIYKMTQEQIKEYPNRIVGYVSEIPEYETWSFENVIVNNRIWIKVK